MAPKTPSFTRTPVPPAAVPAVPLAQLTQGQPLPTGKVYVTDHTRQQLQQIGWKEGDPIPANLGQKIAEIQARLGQEADLPPTLPPGFKTPRPRMVDISQLPAAEQDELRGFMAEARQLAVEQTAREQATAQMEAQLPAGASPAVMAAARTAATAAVASGFVPGQQPTAAINTAGPTASVSARPAVQTARSFVASLGNSSPPVVPPQTPVLATPTTAPLPPPPPSAAVPPPEPPPPPDPPGLTASSAGGAEAPSHCPRCQWNMRMLFEADPTEQDREAYIVAILAQSRFRKEYGMLGDRLRVTFRSLTSREAELMYSQLRRDMRTGAILTDAEYFMAIQTYRLALGLEKLVSEDQVLVEVPALLDIPYDVTQANGESQLDLLVKWLWDEAVPNESLRRVLGQKHREFQRLVEALEAQTTEPDFWKGIGQQH